VITGQTRVEEIRARVCSRLVRPKDFECHYLTDRIRQIPRQLSSVIRQTQPITDTFCSYRSATPAKRQHSSTTVAWTCVRPRFKRDTVSDESSGTSSRRESTRPKSPIRENRGNGCPSPRRRSKQPRSREKKCAAMSNVRVVGSLQTHRQGWLAPERVGSTSGISVDRFAQRIRSPRIRIARLAATTDT